MRRTVVGTLISCALPLGVPTQAQTGPSPVLTQRYDNLRSGVNANETILKTANVQPATFGRIFTRLLDNGAGGARCQPLYVPGLTIQGAVHNVVYVVTQGNYVFAFDADDPLAPTLWSVNLTPPGGSVKAIDSLGVIATPVIDPSSGTLYVLSKTVEGPINRPASSVFRLHALDLLTGQERSYSPAVINFSVPGTGATAIRGVISFNPMMENSKTALLLTQGKILFGFSAAMDETNPNYHGYIAVYDAATFRRTAVWCSTPNGSRGGVWQSGNGLMSDDQGNVWVAVGNGTTSPATSDYGEGVVRLALTSNSLTAVDYFIPHDWNNLNTFDGDIGVIGPVMLPGSKYLVQGSKSGKLYMLDPFNLGKLGDATDSNIPQWFLAGIGEVHGAPVAYVAPDGATMLYVMPIGDNLHGYNLLSSGLVDTTSRVQNSAFGPFQGGFMIISTQGNTPGTGILWCYRPDPITATGNFPAVLEAYDASTFNLLWTSKQNISRDNCGSYVKWGYPTVANGKVYVGASSQEFVVYGLLNNNAPAAPTGLSASILGTNVKVSWTPVPGAVAYNIRVSPTAGGPYNLKAFHKTTTSTVLGFNPSGNTHTNYYVVSAVNANGESANSAELAFSPWPTPPVLSATSTNGVPTLTWPAAAQATAYSVWRGTQSGGPYTVLTSGLTTLSYTDNTVAANTKYYYVVTATNAFGASGNSNQVTN